MQISLLNFAIACFVRRIWLVKTLIFKKNRIGTSKVRVSKSVLGGRWMGNFAGRVCSKHFFRSASQQKYSILELSFEIQSSKKKFVCANKSRFYCLYIKKKTRCVSLSIYIFSYLTCKMKNEINNQIIFPQRLKMYSLTLYAV